MRFDWFVSSPIFFRGRSVSAQLFASFRHQSQQISLLSSGIGWQPVPLFEITSGCKQALGLTERLWRSL
jgi:hypothetical protein